MPTDTSTALKTGYDLLDGALAGRVLDAPRARPGALPAVVLPGHGRWAASARASRAATGLRPGTPVIAGMTDGCAAQLGAGRRRAPATGTPCWARRSSSRASPTSCCTTPPAPSTATADPQAGWWLPGGASSTGAAVLAELVDPSRFDEHHRRRCSPTRPRELPVVYPLVGHRRALPVRRRRTPRASGSTATAPARWPSWSAPSASGRVRRARRGRRVRRAAVLRPRRGPRRRHRRPRTITGGATRNRWWNQRRADVPGAALARPGQRRAGVGMAMLARAAVARRRRRARPRGGRGARWCASPRSYEPRRTRRSTTATAPSAPRSEARLARRGRMTELVLVRHGETVWHADNRYAGRSDVALTERGPRAGRALARWAADAGLDAVLTSPLRRARETAGPAARGRGPPAAGRRAPRRGRLRQGRRAHPRRDARARSPTPSRRSSLSGEPPAARGRGRRGRRGPRPAGLREACREHPDGRVLVVAHQTLLRLLLCALLDIPLDRYRTVFPRLGATSR